MTGIICINKPQEFTSFDVVASMRRAFGTKKIGHGGTLDPMATGVLPVFVGGATKAVDLVPDDSKSYRAGFRLGFVSDTQDIWGKLRSRCENGISEDEMRFALDDFRGGIMQVPPMYSALKVNGQKLCDLARRGIEVERKPRPATISRLELVSFDGTDGVIDVDCSGGTYIRTLLEDIAAAMGQKGTMSALRRTSAGVYTEADAHTLEEILAAKEQGLPALEALMLPVESVFESLPLLVVEPWVEQHLYNGCPTSRYPAADGRYRVRNAAGQFLGLANIVQGVLRVEKLFVERN